MQAALARIPRLPGKIARNVSLSTRLALVVLLVALVSLLATSIVGLQRAGDIADDVLRERIEAINTAKATQVELYIGGITRSAVAQSISPSAADAIDAFAAAFSEIRPTDSSIADVAELGRFYLEEVAPDLSALRGRPISASGLLPQTAGAVYLQSTYVVGAVPGGVDDAGDGSQWSAVHDSLHQSFVDVAISLAVDDIYLIEPVDHTIVYSTAKDIDFATDLRSGPHSGGSLAGLINSFGDRPTAASVAIRDFTSSSVATGEPSAFVASPVVSEGRLVGYLAYRFSPDRLNSIVTNDGAWTSNGDTGQTFVVARDGFLRSDTRGFVDDEDAYLDELAAAGVVTDEQVRLMRRFATTVLFHPASDAPGAFEQASSLEETTDQLGTSIIRARQNLAIDGLDWAILTAVDRQELEQPIIDFTRNLLIAIAVFLVVITFLAVRWTDRLLEPVRFISTNLRAVRSGVDSDAQVCSSNLAKGSASEFVTLADDVDTMLSTLNARNADATERAGERQRLLSRVLPSQAARRAAAGERNVIDQVAQATIAVVAIRGLGAFLASGSHSQARMLLDRFVDEADALAKQRGLERLQLTGDVYVAGCGTARPYIDHAARALAFVVDVRELVSALSDDEEPSMSIGAGLDSGPVTIGLTCGNGLVYDAWGATVTRAADLAQRAAPNSVLVSAATRSRLSSHYHTDRTHDAEVFEVVGRGTDHEAAR